MPTLGKIEPASMSQSLAQGKGRAKPSIPGQPAISSRRATDVRRRHNSDLRVAPDDPFVSATGLYPRTQGATYSSGLMVVLRSLRLARTETN